MRSILVLPLMVLAGGSLAQDITSSDSSTTSLESTPSETPPVIDTPPVVNTPSVTPTVTDDGSSTPSVTPSASDSVVTTPSDSASSSSAGSTDSGSAAATGTGTLDVDDPTATYAIPPDFYDVTNIDEGHLEDVQPSLDEAIDIGALQVNSYAYQVADGKLAPPDDPNERPVAVLPACPNIKAAAERAALSGRAIRLPKFRCVKKTLVIKVHFNYVMPSSNTPQKAKDDALKRAMRNFELLNAVYNPFNIEFTLASYNTPVLKWFSEMSYYKGDGFYATETWTKANQNYMKLNRKGGFEELNIWIVNSINVINADSNSIAGFATFPNWNKAHDGIVLRLSALTPVDGDLLTSTKDKDTCVVTASTKAEKQLRGSTLIHEVGHWMGLKHVHEGGCAGTDSVSDTYQVEDDQNRSCCQQVSCQQIAYRSSNWMSYSRCAGASAYERPFNPSAFTNGQSARMFTFFQRYRTKEYRCDELIINKRNADPLQRRREEDQAKVLADLLLNNCSVAIQDVFAPDSIPLGKADLAVYSSSASFLQANPTPVPAGVVKPSTVTYGTSQPTATVPGGGGPNVITGGGSGSGLGSTGMPKPTNAAPALTGAHGNGGMFAVSVWVALATALGFFLI
ncbi:hypothetical protein Micbo1qcDRAFT_209069 [Microdochium bolleyi]|uniref:Peptidase M43 pregnancy-associated plasma-A domain-containing protein n=1 Tax=Microdochium bolleyi TaxID=196109 RepID=A0A136IN51_9PEZI|nr:hypothetical protein Micbo1qcDRAFT_209069 [Microdochium bolleyi]